LAVIGFVQRILGIGTLSAALLLSACALAPAENEHLRSYALPRTQAGTLQQYGQRVSAELAPDESAFWLLNRADLALSARLALIDEAEAALDVQYFIWRADASGRLVMHRLIQAADRGVRVRLLLDDMTLNGKDLDYLALDRHPLVEVRTYNPWSSRTLAGRASEYLLHRKEMKHRMHFKTILADQHFVMIGGRNIGDRYFGLYEEFVHNDLDIMSVGPLVADVSESFDLYWNSAESYPITDVAGADAGDPTLDEFTASLVGEYMTQQEKLRGFPLQPVEWQEYLELLAETYVVGTGRVEYDLPMVGDQLPTQLYQPFKEFVAAAREEVIIITAYFIPDEEFIALLHDLTARGVRVVVLTNSLASNNHPIAHTGYRRWRRRTLEAGVELYEARADAQSLPEHTTGNIEPGWLGLHIKAAVVDRHRSFVGSPNVDPRSFVLNSEIAFIIDSDPLAAELIAILERDTASQNAWRVTMDEEGWLKWTSNPKTLTRQPAQGWSQRFLEFLVNLLPLKDQV